MDDTEPQEIAQADIANESNSRFLLLKQSAQYLPIFYVVLVFLGYLNMQSFYSYFDIPIYNFISINEVVIPFLPIIIQLLLAVFYVLLMIIIYKNDTSLSNEEYIGQSIKYLFKLKTWRQKHGIKRVLVIIGEILNIVIRSGIYIFVAVNTIKLVRNIIDKDRAIYENYYGCISTIFVLLIATMPLIDRIIKKIMKEFNCFHLIEGYKIIIFRFMIGYFLINAFANYSLSVRINHGEPRFVVEFQTENGRIKSDSLFVYLGKTNDYLFMRDLKTLATSIYPMKDIHELKMAKFQLIKPNPSKP